MPNSDPHKPATLSYASPVGMTAKRPPAWAYVVVGIYLLLLAGLLIVPFVAAGAGAADNERLVVSGTAVALLAAGLSLLITPVRAVRGRPVRGIVLWIPMLGFGLLATLLMAGATIAVWELCT